MNYMPASESGASGELGFRPEWAEMSPEGAQKATVQVAERVGDFSYLLCTMANGWRIYLRSMRTVAAGSEVRFNVLRHVFFREEPGAENAPLAEGAGAEAPAAH